MIPTGSTGIRLFLRVQSYTPNLFIDLVGQSERSYFIIFKDMCVEATIFTTIGLVEDKFYSYLTTRRMLQW